LGHSDEFSFKLISGASEPRPRPDAFMQPTDYGMLDAGTSSIVVVAGATF